ncbi:methylmalonic aciduria and homocystinuria type C protein homolog [Lingula anatina]|uniref:Cyanocobalamin reductase (cyanide-eliminating) n=1 Tax=Lingula anatina TaxID=7574 RepID=A0A1S3K4G9_LINAN|nr:methylmalonic aciduria and homocystinuria type C protein homolog [Lingula anatina]|eukprot:XP_013417146.1 methylmalonic aciduria and homocystinuria type C protein homolog [Lingula anatina]
METDWKTCLQKVAGILHEVGFESHPFKIAWYNMNIKPIFYLDYAEDTLAVVIISTPAMYEKAFKPFICKRDCLGVKDPIDECIEHYFAKVKEAFPENEVISIHDYELHGGTRRPKVLVQTAAHVAGAARYYQRSDLTTDPWEEKKKIFGVSVHPKYGGWFAIRGVLIFKDVLCSDLQRKEPPDVVPTDELKKELLERYNFHWQDWSFRDIIPVENRYSEEQKTYFSTLPKDRLQLLNSLKSDASNIDNTL